MQYLAIASAIVGGVSAYAQGTTESKQLQAASQASMFNAAILRDRAQLALSTANQREERQRRMARLAAGERRAAIAQSGTGFEGSNLDMERQSEMFAELDALNIRYEGQLENQALLQEAFSSEQQGHAYATSARMTRRMIPLNVAAAALSGYGLGAAASRYGSVGGGGGMTRISSGSSISYGSV